MKTIFVESNKMRWGNLCVLRKKVIFRQVCRGEHCSPVRFARYIALPGWLQRAAYMPPLQITRIFRAAVLLRAGLAPPLLRDTFIYCSVGRGDPTPQGKSLPPLGEGGAVRAG